MVLNGLISAGCTIGGDGKSFLNENDELRAENQKLNRQVEQTQQQIQLLEGELSAYRQLNAGASPIEGATPPVLSGLELMRYTGPVDTDRDGADDAVRVYLRPTDQRGRMLVVAGRLDIQVLSIRGEAEPRVLADVTLTPKELDAAYRTGLTGDHYSVELPFAEDVGIDQGESATVAVTLTESGSGVVVRAQASAALDR